MKSVETIVKLCRSNTDTPTGSRDSILEGKSRCIGCHGKRNPAHKL